MVFRGCINSALEQLIKKNNVPMNSTTRKRKRKERREREEERVENRRRTIRLIFPILYHSFYLIPFPCSIYAICIYSFLY